MSKFSTQWIVAALIVIVLSPAMAGAAEFHGSLSGTQTNTNFDTNSDGITVAEIDGAGRFTQLGTMTAKGINEGLPWDGSSFCSATHIGLGSFYFHMILTGENGDMLFTEETSLDLCWDYTDYFWTATHHMQIVGGTGKFAQATGQFDCYNEGSPLLTPLNVPIGYTWEAECEGEIEF